VQTELGSEVTQTGQALTPVTSVDFENLPLGPLAAPFSVTKTGASSIAVENTSDHGRVAALHGSAVSGDFLTASLGFTIADPVVHVELEIRPTASAAFVVSLHGAGSSLSARSIRLQRNPGSESLTAGAANTACGTVRSGAWSRVALDVHSETHTFSVAIDGAGSACTGIATGIAAPFDNVTLMDASNDAFGGVVQFDRIAVSSDATAPCVPLETPPAVVFDVDFDADPLGALGAPWSVTAAGSSSARIVNATGRGRALQLHGGTTAADSLVATRSFSAPSSQTDIAFELALRPVSGSAFVVALKGTGPSLGARSIRLQRSPGSNALVATSASGNVSCGDLPNDTWSDVTLSVHTQRSPHTYDVSIGSRASACTGVVTELSAPFGGIDVMDGSNAGFGGDVLFDDLLATASGPVAGSCP
jgi:hypothetical protein